MSRPVAPPALSHDHHLRQLLDQRAARADLPRQPDSPSVYRPVFSVDPSQDPHVDTPFFTSPFPSTHYSQSPRSSSDRTSATTSIPATSMLDLSDDPRSSFATSYDDSSHYDDEDARHSVCDEANDDDDEPIQRMSIGPKMRVHSRAPWEMDNEDEQEARDDVGCDYDNRDCLMKGVTARKIFHLRSPSASARRPSTESSCSQNKPRLSLDTPHPSHSRGALYALAQDTLSVTSLGASGREKASRGAKFSLAQLRQHLPGTTSRTPSLASSERADTDAHSRPSFEDDAVHPYANPDLVSPYTQDQPRSYPTTRTSSAVTITEPLRPATPTQRSTASSEMPRSSAESPKTHTSPTRRKDISSPLLIHNRHIEDNFPLSRERFASLPHADLTQLPGWNDKSSLQSFSLISLEEAQAQRARGAVASAAISSDRASVPFPEREEESVHTYTHSPSSSLSSGFRGRTVSAGAKAKHSFHSIVGVTLTKSDKRDTEPPPPPPSSSSSSKSLKHKKSGFMRLFNSSKDKDASPPPPPVPSISDPHIQHISKPTKSVGRIPVPDLPEDDSRTTPSPKRTVPNLSINTQASSQSHSSPSSAITAPLLQPMLRVPSTSERGNAIPQSAPPNMSEFPALRLRPMSSLFSPELAEHIGDQQDVKPPADRADLDITQSPSSTAVISPITPVSSRFEADPKMTVQSLEDHLVSTKLAWQRQIWELEGQVRDLKAEVAELRSASKAKTTHDDDGVYCDACGRGSRLASGTRGTTTDKRTSVVNRPRARTGSSRLGHGFS
ncbi:hypothetical protein AX16_006453 [Volvariella volvacea WC 439]|nr:hypothetical protein AX16_006453 [Volvariella volvacea WC 439]